MYTPFELDIPNDLAGALAALANGAGETVLPLAGGTNLIVDIRAKRERPDRMVGLGEVDELLGMEFEPERITIGGRTTVSDLLRSPEIAPGGTVAYRIRPPLRRSDGAQYRGPSPGTSRAARRQRIWCRRFLLSMPS